MKTDIDIKIIEAMIVYGGSFVKSLAKAALVADSNNFVKLKQAFPEYWEEYTKFIKIKD